MGCPRFEMLIKEASSAAAGMAPRATLMAIGYAVVSVLIESMPMASLHDMSPFPARRTSMGLVAALMDGAQGDEPWATVALAFYCVD